MMKYWRINDFDEALDKSYINYMMLNACIYDGKEGKSENSGSMSFFEFGEQLAGIK